jgi:hypothetical protein
MAVQRSLTGSFAPMITVSFSKVFHRGNSCQPGGTVRRFVKPSALAARSIPLTRFLLFFFPVLHVFFITFAGLLIHLFKLVSHLLEGP